MVVDSCDAEIKPVTRLLEDEGYEFVSGSSNSIVEDALKQRPELIVLDYDNNGSIICDKLHGHTKTQYIPIVGICQPGVKFRALNINCIDFILNSDSIDSIARKLKTYLRVSKITHISRKLMERG